MACISPIETFLWVTTALETFIWSLFQARSQWPRVVLHLCAFKTMSDSSYAGTRVLQYVIDSKMAIKDLFLLSGGGGEPQRVLKVWTEMLDFCCFLHLPSWKYWKTFIVSGNPFQPQLLTKICLEEWHAESVLSICIWIASDGEITCTKWYKWFLHVHLLWFFTLHPSSHIRKALLTSTNWIWLWTEREDRQVVSVILVYSEHFLTELKEKIWSSQCSVPFTQITSCLAFSSINLCGWKCIF